MTYPAKPPMPNMGVCNEVLKSLGDAFGVVSLLRNDNFEAAQADPITDDFLRHLKSQSDCPDGPVTWSVLRQMFATGLRFLLAELEKS